MAIRSTALQSALAGMTGAHNRLETAAQNLSQPILRREISGGDSPGATRSMSEDVGRSLTSLHESLTEARVSSVTAGAAQAMLDRLLEIGRL